MSLSFFVRTGRRSCRRRKRQNITGEKREKVRNCRWRAEAATRNMEFMLGGDINIEWPNFH